MSPQSGPPAGTPQLSPDHKWIWDGTQWRPIAVHEAAFPEWKTVGADLPVAQQAPPPQAVAPRSAQAQARGVPAPAGVVYAPVTPAPAQSAPLWRQQRSTGLNKYLYWTAGIVGLLIVAIFLSSLGSLGSLSFPWAQAPQARPLASPTPKLSERSDFARADRFVNQLLAPPMSEMSQDVLLVKQVCYGALTPSCEDAMIAEDNQITTVSAVIQKETIPLCIAAPVSKMQTDLASAHTAIQAGEKAYRDNRTNELGSALAGLRTANAAIQGDSGAMAAAAKTCDGQVSGP